MQKESFLTLEGLEKLKEELEHLRTARRHEVAEKIQRAKELGGTVNNAEYDDAKNEQAFVEGRILTLENTLKHAVVISGEGAPPGEVRVGSRVTVRTPEGTEEHYVLVGSAEAEPAQGRISNESPVGQALIGRKVGDEVEIQAPAGTRTLKLTAIE